MLLWSLALTACLNHLAAHLNPFLGSVLSFSILVAVLVQLIILRKRGLRYVAAFFACLLALTSLFMYLDERMFQHPRRYYSVQ